MKTSILLITAIILFSTIAIFNSSTAKADVYVYDNNNQYLGILIEMGDRAIIVFIPALEASWGGYYGGVSGCPSRDVYFKSSDCSGTPYVYGPNPVIVDLTGIPNEGGFYKADYNGKETFVYGSWYNYCECITSQGSEPRDYFSLTEVQMPFATPIAFPLRFEVRTNNGDLDLDGDVDGEDLGIFSGHFGEISP